MRKFLCLILLALLVPGLALSSNNHGTGSEAGERESWWFDSVNAYVASGCQPAVPGASLIITAFACTGYVKDTTSGRMIYIDQSASAVTVPDSPTVWLGLHKDTFTSVPGFTRQLGTHYILQANATQPPDPDGATIFAQVTVAASVITVITDVSPLWPFGDDINPDMLGAVSDPAAGASVQAANVVAFQTVLDRKGVIRTPPNRHYRFDAALTIRPNSTLECGDNTRLEWTHAGVGINFNTSGFTGYPDSGNASIDIKIRNCIIEGANNGNLGQTAGNDAIAIDNGDVSVEWGTSEIDKNTINNWGDAGVAVRSGVFTLNVRNNWFRDLWRGVEVLDPGANSSTGWAVENNLFNRIGDDCIHMVATDAVKVSRNTVQNCGGEFTHFISTTSMTVIGNRLEANGTHFGHLWDGVTGSFFRGSEQENVHLDNVSRDNIIFYTKNSNGWGGNKGAANVTAIFEDTANGAGGNVITITGTATANSRVLYNASSIDITSEVIIQSDGTQDFGHTNRVRQIASTPFTITQGGVYECRADLVAANVAIGVARAKFNPFAEPITITKTDTGAFTCTITPQTDAEDSGAIDGVVAPMVLRKGGDFVALAPRPAFTVVTAPYINNLALNWISTARRISNDVTCAAAATCATVADTSIRADNVVLLMPTNGVGAQLQGSSQHVYVSAIVAGTSFTLSTGDATAAAGTETFRYIIQ